MKQIIAKQEYTDKYVSLYEGQIRNIENDLADRLIEKGIVAEHNDSGNEDNTLIINMLIKKDLTETHYDKYDCQTEMSSKEVLSMINNNKYIVIKAAFDNQDGAPTEYLFTRYFYPQIGQLTRPEAASIYFSSQLFFQNTQLWEEKINCSEYQWNFEIQKHSI